MNLAFRVLVAMSLLSVGIFGQVPELGQELESQVESLRVWPAWLITEKGKLYREEGRLSDAFNFFYAALEKEPANPQIEVELARAFLQSGDLSLTLFHLDRALEKQQGFPNREMIYDVRYFRADLAHLEERYWDYEQELLTIIEDDVFFRSIQTNDENLKENIQENLVNRGINRTLVLYRIPDSFSLDAHRQLGIFYVQSGRYDQALRHLTFAVIKSYTRVIDEYRSRVLDFQFSNLADLHERIERQSGLVEFLESVNVYESLFYLSEALLGFDRSKVSVAREIWEFLVNVQNDHGFRSVSELRLENPFP